MARSRFFTYFSFGGLSVVGFLVPHVSFAASVVGVFNPIISQSGACLCVGLAPGWGCILQVIQNITNVGISIGIVVCVLYLAYAGILFMMSSANPGLREQGRARIVNGVVGMLVILGAWVTVDFIMKVLYDPTTAFTTNKFGPWNGILASNGTDNCIQAHNPVPITTGNALDIIAGAPLDPSVPGTLNGSGVGACSAAEVQAGAAAGGYQITAIQANQLRCIANHESSCGTANGPGNPNYSWNKANSEGKASTAAGPFQVLLRTNSDCYDNAACELAAGTPGKALNCKTGFNSDGFITVPAKAQQCLLAAGNLACSASAAACQLQHQSFTSMYASDPDVGKCSGGT